MGGMPSTNAPGYAPQQSAAPVAGGKMPASQSQYGPPQQYSRGRGMPQAPQAGGKMPASQSQYGPQQQQKAQTVQSQQIPQDVLSRYNQVSQPSQGPGGYGTQQQAQPFQMQQMLNNIQQGTGALGQMGQQVPQQAQQQPYTGTGQPIPPPTELQRAARQQYFDQDADSQRKAFQANQQRSLGQIGQQAEATPANLSQLYNQLNMAQGMGQGQQQAQQGYPQQGQVGLDQYAAGQGFQQPSQQQLQMQAMPQQSYGYQSFGPGIDNFSQPSQQGTGAMGGSQPSGGFMSGTGGGTTGGGGMSRGKGFRSGGAVNNIRLSNDDVKRILNALATAREVVKNGK